MKLIVITRYYDSEPSSDALIFDLDKCSTKEELIFREEIESFEMMTDDGFERRMTKPSEITKRILDGSGSYEESYLKLNICINHVVVKLGKGTIQYGPTVFM